QIVPAERSNEVGAAGVPVEPGEPVGIPNGMVATRSDYELGVGNETVAIYEGGNVLQAVRYEMGYGYIDVY
ncbi:MAG: hypothetical protein IAF08_12440, partial [Rhizobacter sp.]|nr:hypothetical protein [Chlorobiales bacterium]